MSEMTPEMLREKARILRLSGEICPLDAREIDACASAWEADIAKEEQGDKAWLKMCQEEHDQCVEALARIEALEKLLKEVADYGVPKFNKRIAAALAAEEKPCAKP